MSSGIALALDTSTPFLSAALVREERARVAILGVREHGPQAIVSTLVPAVFDELLSEARLSLADVDVFVAGIGPGLFTGVRVAVGTMKALAFARRKPLLGAGSLHALALTGASGGLAPSNAARIGLTPAVARPSHLPHGKREGLRSDNPPLLWPNVTEAEPLAFAARQMRGARDSGGEADSSPQVVFAPTLCPVLDARKGELYWSLFRSEAGALNPLTEPAASSPAALAERLMAVEGAIQVFGTGAASLAKVLPASERIQILDAPLAPSAACVAAIALAGNPKSAFDLAAVLDFAPFYLRPPEAEIARNRRLLSERP